MSESQQHDYLYKKQSKDLFSSKTPQEVEKLLFSNLKKHPKPALLMSAIVSTPFASANKPDSPTGIQLVGVEGEIQRIGDRYYQQVHALNDEEEAALSALEQMRLTQETLIYNAYQGVGCPGTTVDGDMLSACQNAFYDLWDVIKNAHIEVVDRYENMRIVLLAKAFSAMQDAFAREIGSPSFFLHMQTDAEYIE